ncbi:unnamed protein product [Lactuca saligna]|uniref:Uncharacterized protein n=1 Tax=Lactuca saligna TaxID=75948 RepID=A0AA35YUQ1_LACSI|nr:unnamed protein product [Lactuca saligna]
MVTGKIPLQPKIYESGRNDNQKAIVVAEQDHPILETDATNRDQSVTGEYKGIFDLGFIAQVVPVGVVYLDTYFKGEISQGTNDIESDDEQLNPKKRKLSFLRGANDVEAGSSSAVSGSSAPPPKRCMLMFDLEDLAIV